MEQTKDMRETVREVVKRAILGDVFAHALINDVRVKARRLQNEGA